MKTSVFTTTQDTRFRHGMGELTAVVHPGTKGLFGADPGPLGRPTVPAQHHVAGEEVRKQGEEARVAIQIFTQHRLDPATNRNVQVQTGCS